MRILRGLGSQRLTCGCLVGLYDTYDGRSVIMLDAPAPDCDDPRHRPNTVLDIVVLHPPRMPAASGEPLLNRCPER